MLKDNEYSLFNLIDDFMRTQNKDLIPKFSSQCKALKEIYITELRKYFKGLKDSGCEDLLYKKLLEKMVDKRFKLAKETLYQIDDVKVPFSMNILGSYLHKQSNYNNTANRVITEVSGAIDEIVKDLELNDKTIYLFKFDCIFTLLKDVYMQYNCKEYYEMEDNILEIQRQLSNQKELSEKEYDEKMKEIISESERVFFSKDIVTNSLKEILSLQNTTLYYETIQNEDFSFNFKEFKKYIDRILRYGEYKDPNAKIKAFKSISNTDPKIKVTPAFIQERAYMINDCSKFKSRFYNFLMSDEIEDKKSMDLKTRASLESKEFYLYTKKGHSTEALTYDHIALLIALESIFINCKEYLQGDGTLFLKKTDLLKLFGENFRGDREEIFANLIRDMAQVIPEVEIFKASRHKTNYETETTKIGKIEGNLVSFSVIRSADNDYVYQIKMPFLQELLKRSTFNTLKSIDLLKYTFKQPKKVLLSEFISNAIYFHVRNYGHVPKKISIKSVLVHLNLYNKFKEMSSKDCNKYLERLKGDIEISCSLIRNIERVEFTKLSSTMIEDKSIGFTIYLKEKEDDEVNFLQV